MIQPYPAQRRRRLTARFKPVIDGLFDKARGMARQKQESDAEQFDREWFGGSWLKTHPFSHDVAITERTSGNPLNTLGRCIDCAHRGEIQSVALVAIGTDGVIHTAWSDGDYELMGKAARFLSQDLAHEAPR